MLKFKDISIGRKILYIFLIDITIYLISFHFISTYRLFSILITSILTGYLTYLISCYFIQFLKSYDTNTHELDMYQFLFKNEQIYQIISKSIKKFYFNKMKNDIEKDSCILSTNQILGKLDFEINERLMKGIEKFIISLSEYFIEPWYLSFISTNDNFKNEAKLHLESILKNLFNRLIQMNKMIVFSKLIFILNENFINHALSYNLKNQKIITNLLHPAIRNLPESETNYIKKIVQIIIRKSSHNLEINNEFVEEFFMQIIGKNCVENLVNHLVKPQFLYYALCLLLDKEKTQQFINECKNFSEKDSTKPEKEIESLTNLSCLNRFLLCNDFIDSQDIHYDRLKKSTSVKSLPIKEFFIPVDIITSRYLEIVNIEVIGSDTSKEPKTGKEFTLYTIQFDFKYVSESSDIVKSDGVENSFIETKQIKRRYKEFVSLQKILEDKYFLKNLKGPTKFNSPIGNMEIEIVEKRRRKLNDYLNSLICLAEICQSKEFSNFLGLNFKEDFNTQQSNSSLLRSVSEILKPNSIETSDHIINFAKLQQNCFEYKASKSFRQFRNKHKSFLEDLKNSYNEVNILRFPSLNNRINLSKNVLQIFNKILLSCYLKCELSSRFLINSSTIYKLIDTCLCDFYCERFFQDIINKILNFENLVTYLEEIRIILFKNKEIGSETNKINFSNLFSRLIEQKLPDFFKNVMGSRYNCCIKILIDSLGIEILNKHFIYCAIDVFLESLFSIQFK